MIGFAYFGAEKTRARAVHRARRAPRRGGGCRRLGVREGHDRERRVEADVDDDRLRRRGLHYARDDPRDGRHRARPPLGGQQGHRDEGRAAHEGARLQVHVGPRGLPRRVGRRGARKVRGARQVDARRVREVRGRADPRVRAGDG